MVGDAPMKLWATACAGEFYNSLIHARVIWEDELSIEKMFPEDGLMRKFV